MCFFLGYISENEKLFQYCNCYILNETNQFALLILLTCIRRMNGMIVTSKCWTISFSTRTSHYEIEQHKKKVQAKF